MRKGTRRRAGHMHAGRSSRPQPEAAARDPVGVGGAHVAGGLLRAYSDLREGAVSLSRRRRAGPVGPAAVP
eukprot:SAG22_NODE_471_length_10112_cov_14.774094_2_plen_71_part_00